MDIWRFFSGHTALVLVLFVDPEKSIHKNELDLSQILKVTKRT